MRKQSEKEIKYREKFTKLCIEKTKLEGRINWYMDRIKKEVEKSLDHVGSMTVKNADWKEILALETPESEVKYKKYDQLMQELGFWPGQYYPETMQRCIKIMIRRSTINECITKTIISLKIVIPYIKPIKCKNGRKYKVIQIFCNYEPGIPELLIKNDGKACIFETRFSRGEFKTKWMKLKEALLYIGLNHAYEDD